MNSLILISCCLLLKKMLVITTNLTNPEPPLPYVFGKNEWKEKYLGKKEFMPKILKKRFLSELGHAPLPEKENELLNKNFGFENIDELVEAFNNRETKEEYNKLFNRIRDRAIILKKLVKTVSNPVEEKELRI